MRSRSIHQRTLELIVVALHWTRFSRVVVRRIDALDPDVISSVLLADPGQRLWPKAGRRVPEDYKQLITPLPIAPSMGACGTAAFRKERVISADIASDPLWSGPAEPGRGSLCNTGSERVVRADRLRQWRVARTFGLHHAQSKSVSTEDIELLEKAGHIALIASSGHAPRKPSPTPSPN